MINKNAYVAFITNDNYIPGLKVLHKSLLQTKPKYPLYVVVPEDSDKEFVDKIAKYSFNQEVIKMPRIDTDIYIYIYIYRQDEKYSYWKDTFFKLNAARLLQFEKIVLLDLDLLILQNIDDLFEYQHLSAVVSGKIANPEWDTLNSGVLVIEPNIEYFDRLLSLIKPVCESKNGVCGDQDVFEASIPEWPNQESLHIPEEYNEFYRCAGKLAKTLKNGWKDLKVIHYWGKKKPWNYSKKELFIYYLKNIRYRRFDLNKCMNLYLKVLKKTT